MARKRKTDSEELLDEIELEEEIDIDDESEDGEEGSLRLNLITVLILLIAAAVTTAYFMCTVRTVHVSGNKLYTSREIADQVISDDTQLRHNTIFLAALYMTPFAPKIPFEESVRVHIESYEFFVGRDRSGTQPSDRQELDIRDGPFCLIRGAGHEDGSGEPGGS